MTAVSWCDGDVCQMKAITSLKNIDFNEKNCVVDNKQSVSRTGVEQAADLGGQCSSTKVMSKSITLKNKPSNVIKNKVTDALKEHSHVIKLKHDNKKG